MMLMIFPSTREVIRTEKLVRQARLECKIIPVPRNISSQCGMAIKFDPAIQDQINELIKKHNISTEVLSEF